MWRLLLCVGLRGAMSSGDEAVCRHVLVPAAEEAARRSRPSPDCDAIGGRGCPGRCCARCWTGEWAASAGQPQGGRCGRQGQQCRVQGPMCDTAAGRASRRPRRTAASSSRNCRGTARESGNSNQSAWVRAPEGRPALPRHRRRPPGRGPAGADHLPARSRRPRRARSVHHRSCTASAQVEAPGGVPAIDPDYATPWLASRRRR